MKDFKQTQAQAIKKLDADELAALVAPLLSALWVVNKEAEKGKGIDPKMVAPLVERLQESYAVAAPELRKPIQFEDMLGNPLGDDLAWHRYTLGQMLDPWHSELQWLMDHMFD